MNNNNNTNNNNNWNPRFDLLERKKAGAKRFLTQKELRFLEIEISKNPM